jgi:hypothetical protein
MERNTDKSAPRDGRALAFVSSDPRSVGSELEHANKAQDEGCCGAKARRTPSAASPHHEETKITIGLDGEAATFAVSQRSRLYQILKRLSSIATIPEDEVRYGREFCRTS